MSSFVIRLDSESFGWMPHAKRRNLKLVLHITPAKNINFAERTPLPAAAVIQMSLDNDSR